ncbi:MAG: PaaI family thioesterase [Betaproteobacteria bacterium]|nr:PaaI family thioesterase [Betaproteobacteria bacterium]
MATNQKRQPPQWRSSPPFYEHLGLKLDALAAGRSVIRLPFRKRFGNSRGEVHGGAVAALADAAMSQAVRSTVELGAAVATISLTLNYLAPAHGGLTCAGTVVRGGRSVVFAEAEVTDECDKSVCRATATYRLLPKK